MLKRRTPMRCNGPSNARELVNGIEAHTRFGRIGITHRLNMLHARAQTRQFSVLVSSLIIPNLLRHTKMPFAVLHMCV